ncbi:MAG: PAS domain-containing protein, partial [Pirellulaceae bacterium]
MADVAEVNLARLRAVVQSLADGIVISDRDGNLLDWNPAALRMHGLRSVDEVRRHLSTFDRDFELSEGDGRVVPLADWPLSRLLRGETVVGWELQVRRLDAPNGLRVIRFNGHAVCDPAGGADLVVLTLHDVTEMRAAERNAMHAAQLLRAVTEGTTDALFAKDTQGRYLFCNPAAARYLNHPTLAVLGRTDQDLFGPEVAARIRSQDLRVMQSGVAESEERQVPVGDLVRCFQVSRAPFRDEAGLLAGIVGSARDVTARKRREDELRASRQRLADAQEIAGLGNWYWEPDTGYVWWSEESARLFGVDLSTFVPSYESYLRLVHPEDRERVVQFVDRIAESGDVGDYDVRIVRPDGQMLWIYSRSRAIRDASGRLIRLEGTDQDITERKLTEQNLRASEQRFRDLADALPQIVWIAGKDGALEYLNRQAMEYSGLPSQRLSGWAWEDVVHPDDLEETIHGWSAAVRTGEPQDLTMRLCRADGEYRWHIARQVPIRDATGAISKWYGTCT